MFIEAEREIAALRPVRRAMSMCRPIHPDLAMAILAESSDAHTAFYKHCHPGGGRTWAVAEL